MLRTFSLVLYVALFLISTEAAAQDRFYHVYIDTDNSTSTGCDVNLPDFATAINGAEGRVTITTNSNQPPAITATNYHLCDGGVFDSGTAISPAALGLNTSLNNEDVFEAQIPTSALGVVSSGSVTFYYVTESDTASDIVLTNSSGGPILLGFAFPVPAIGLLALGLLIFGFVLMTGRSINQKLTIMLVFIGASSVAWAMGIIVDGQTSDWNSINPKNTDPINDTSVPGSFADLTQIYLVEQNGIIYFRMDVVDLENQAPVANDTSDTTLEENTVTITVTGSDAENEPLTFAVGSAPADGTLSAFTVVNDTTSTVDYTPNTDFTGIDTFTITANDGQVNSGPGTVDVTVTAINDEPAFTSGGDVNQLKTAGPYNQAWATAVAAGPANESGQTLTFSILSNDSPAIFTSQPSLDSAGVLTFEGVLNATGTANLTVNLTDDGGTANGGDDTSTTVNFSITLQGVNDEPSFTVGLNQTGNEDPGAVSVAMWATAILAGPPDESGQVLTFNITANDNSALFSAGPAVTADGTLNYTPAADANGVANITLELMDDGGTADGGDDTSPTQNFSITVDAVNDAPLFTAGPNDSVLEGAGAQTVNGWATGISPGPADEAAQTVSFIVTNDNNALFSVQPVVDPTGNLTYTPTPAALGTATVSVSISDNGGTANGGVDTSAVQTFSISVTMVNDEPSFTVGPNQTSNEDSGAVSVAPWATAILAGPPDESGQNLTFNITANSNPALFSAGPAVAADGTLSYTPAADANGVANITLELMDDGGTANGGDDTSPAQNFSITVNAVNDAPLFTAGPNDSVLEGAGAQTVNGWATGISPGPADEAAQTISFTVTNDNNALFSVQPAVDPAGNLTYTPTATALGTATVSVSAIDTGGTANGGVDTSVVQTFNISVTMVNDEPSFTVGPNQVGNEDPGAVSVAAWATAILAGPPDESGQNLTFNITANSNPALFSAGPAVAADGTLSYTPAADANGVANITLELMDDGGTANGGDDTSPAQNFSITVNAVNDVPSYTSGGDVTVDENSGAFDNSWATAISAGPTNENGQTLNFNIVNVTNNSVFSVAPTVDGTTGNLSFTPATDTFGVSTVTINLMDDGLTTNGGVDTTTNITFDISISEVNESPVLTNIVDPSVDELTLLTFTATATDPNIPAQNLTFSLGGTVPTGASITAGGDFSWSPTEAQGTTGTFTFDVIVTDDGTNPDDLTDSQAITVTVDKVNTAPVLNVIGAQSIDELVNLNFTVTATDIDTPAQNLTFSLGGTIPAGATISTAGAFSWIPSEAQGSGVYNFDVIVTDDGINPANLFDTETISVTVNDVNSAPVLTAIGNQTVDEETNLSFAAMATDSDIPAQGLSFSLGGAIPAGASITLGGMFSWTPTEAQGPGVYNFDVVVTDDGANLANLSDIETITVTVNEINAVPVADTQSTTTDDATVLAIILTGSDSEGSALTFAIDTAPPTGSLSGITQLTPSSASVTYTPGVVGNNNFTFVVNDGVLNSVPATVTLSVTSSNSPPVANADAYDVTGNVGIDVPVGSGVIFNDTDPDIDVLMVSAVGADVVAPFTGTSAMGGNITVQANGSFTYDPAVGFNGADSFVYTLSDGSLTDTATVNLTVAETVWFIDNSAAGGGDGRLISPFNSINSFNTTATDAVGEVIHIDFGNGTSTGYDTGIALLNTQRLLGQGVALNTTNSGIAFPSHTRALPATATNPTLVTTNANSITLANGNFIRGLTVGNTGTGTAIIGSNFGTLTTSNVSINGTGKAIDLTIGTAAVVFDSISSTSSASEVIDLDTVAGNLTVNGGTVSGAGANASTILIDNSSGNFAANFNNVNMGANHPTGEHGIHFITTGSAVGNLNVNGSAFTGSRRNMILAEIGGTGGSTINIGNTTANMFVQDQSPDALGGDDVIHITAFGSGTINTNISNNTILTGAFTFEGDGIAVQNLPTFSGTHRATVSSNTIGMLNTNGSAFDPLDNQGDAGIEIIGAGNSTMIALVNNNNVFDYNASGIEANFGGSGNYDVTFTNNTVSDGLGSSGFDAAIAVFGGGSVTACIQVDGNTLNDPTNEEADVDILGAGTYRDPGLITLSDPGLEAHLISTNTGTAPYTAAAFTVGVAGGGACIQP